jgi:hypothetical protein
MSRRPKRGPGRPKLEGGGAAHVTISVPLSLRKAIDRERDAGGRINISRICSLAIERELQLRRLARHQRRTEAER